MRPRAVAIVAIVAILVPIAALAVLAVLPRSVIGDIAYPPPTPLPAQPECPLSSESNPLCIVVLGDSIAAGVPLEGDERWWMRMEDALAAALPNRPVAVANWAVPRSRLDVLESATTDQPALDSFDIAIVLEGVNDVGRTPVDAWAKGYEAAVERMEARGLTVVVATPPPNFEDGAIQHRHDEIDDAVRAMTSHHRPLLDIAARFMADGNGTAGSYYVGNLHQGDAGQRVIADMATSIVLGLEDAR